MQEAPKRKGGYEISDPKISTLLTAALVARSNIYYVHEIYTTNTEAPPSLVILVRVFTSMYLRPSWPIWRSVSPGCRSIARLDGARMIASPVCWNVNRKIESPRNERTFNLTTSSKAPSVERSAEKCCATWFHQDCEENLWRKATLQRSSSTGGTTVGSAHSKLLVTTLE